MPPDLAGALSELRTRRPDLAVDVSWHDSVPSTMDLAALAVAAGAPHGYVVAANEQTAGRGRRGHEWASPPGAGVYLSFVARPTRDVALVTLTAGTAVREGILASTGLAVDLKWPNDLAVGRRKLAGILAEGLHIGEPDQAVVIGVGINVRSAAYPSDVAARATSIEAALGRRVDRATVLAALLEALSDRLAALERGEAGDILQAWRRSAPDAAGARVEWETPQGPVRGVTDGIDDSGALIVRLPNGVEHIRAGVVRWLDLDSDD